MASLQGEATVGNQRIQKNSQILSTLHERMRLKEAVRFARAVYGDRTVFGFPLRVSRELVLVHEIQESAQDGLVILNCRDISEASWDSEDRRLVEWVKRGIPHTPMVPELDLQDWRSVCHALAAAHAVARVVDETGGQMHTGRILESGTEMVTMRILGPNGQWHKEPLAIGYGDISRMHLPVHYSALLH